MTVVGCYSSLLKRNNVVNQANASHDADPVPLRKWKASNVVLELVYLDLVYNTVLETGLFLFNEIFVSRHWHIVCWVNSQPNHLILSCHI